jgi:hypothetical protein
MGVFVSIAEAAISRRLGIFKNSELETASLHR